MRLIDGDELKTAFPCGESVRTECIRWTIDNMPTIKSESQWMTCSEKLSEIYKPEENKINKEDKKEHIKTKRQFVEIIVRHPNPSIYKYKEYNIKPYYEIKYIENGEEVVGYGTYSPKMLSRYLKDFFMPSELDENSFSSGE